ncbi:MAG: thiamine phosphate synthase [Sideroxydans sp.]|nr:thiamine phosphate synthase [Sideroxydans sp.]
MKRLATKPAVAGLYAITPDLADTNELLRKVRLALQGGARVLQYRNKIADAALQLQQAQALRQLTLEFDTTFIVNDDAALARQVNADGVHLGGEDGSVAAARALLGESKLIGVSCYNRAPLALAAVQQGADYVAFGAFFPSSVKPEAVRADITLLQEVRRALNANSTLAHNPLLPPCRGKVGMGIESGNILASTPTLTLPLHGGGTEVSRKYVPIVAIGGITQQNGAMLIEAGADSLAVISALWDAPDSEQAAKKFSTLFSRTKQ